MLQEGALADKILGKITSGTLQTMSRNASKDALLNWQSLSLLAIDALGLPLALESVGKQLKKKTTVIDWDMDYMYRMEEQLQLWMAGGCLYAHDNRMLHHYEYFEELHSCDTVMLNKLPLGIGGLSKVIIEGSNRHKISKLKGMMKLRGRLSNKGLHKLTQLTLRGYQNCECLPKLGCLGSLKKLFVEGMPKVVTIAPELFPSLEVLELEDMHLDFSKLDDVLIGKMSSLRVILRMERCSEAVLTSIIGASSSIISLEMDNISGLTPLHGEVLQHLGVVEHLCITKCHIVEYLWELKSEARKYLANLKKLEASYCKKLASLGKTTYDIGIATVNLTEVSLTNCEMLQSYKCPQSIKKLVIHNCQSIKELLFPQGQNLSLILDIQRCHSLKIISCRNMKSFPHTLLPTLASLKELLITNCPLMESFLCCSWPPKNRTLKKAYVRMGTLEFLNTLVNWILALWE
ncbi:disease resistance protein [Tanacetum coccineum]